MRKWTSVDDAIWWDVDVGAEGLYEVDLYYTCPAKDVGSKVDLTVGESQLSFVIDTAHDPPLRGQENDRVTRPESYVKDFRRKSLGTIKLNEGKSTLKLQATEVPGESVMDFRLLMFRRVQ
ncbi:MAG: hypothetical protein R3C05_00755 [Pirellulaceae bacterium]